MGLFKIVSVRDSFSECNLELGWTLAHFAARNGNVFILKDLKKVNKKWLKKANYEGVTPAHMAAAFGHVNVLSYLSQVGINLQPEDKYGMTPYIYALHHKQTECVSFLLSQVPACSIS